MFSTSAAMLFSLTEYAKDERRIEREHQAKGETFFNYMNDTEQKQAALTVDDNGIYHNANGHPANGRFLYVVLADNRIIHVPDCRREDGVLYRHSCLANGKKIRGAGKLILENGKLISVSNESGHYKPIGKNMSPVLKDIFIPLSKNPNLIFEDHTEAAKGIAYQYNAQNFAYRNDPLFLCIKEVNAASKVIEEDEDHYLQETGMRSRFARKPNINGSQSKRGQEFSLLANSMKNTKSSVDTSKPYIASDDIFIQPKTEKKEEKSRFCGGLNCIMF
jgi:hypothetical protein